MLPHKCGCLLQDFDRHNTKRVDVSQFRRAITSAGVHLSPDEVDALAHKFADPAGGVNYGRFCDSIDKGACLHACVRACARCAHRRLPFARTAVFTIKGLETRPLYEPVNPLRGGTRRSELGALQVRTAARLRSGAARARAHARTCSRAARS